MSWFPGSRSLVLAGHRRQHPPGLRDLRQRRFPL